MYRYYLNALILACLMLFNSSSQCEQSNSEQQIDLSTIQPKLRIVTESFPPYSYINEQGQIDGAVTQVVLEVLKRLKVAAKIEVLPWARAYQVALHTPNVLIYSIVRIPHREDKFHWLIPATAINIGVYAMPDTKAAKLESISQLDNMVIGVMRESSSINFFKQFRNITDKNLLKLTTFEQLYKMLQYQRVHFALSPELLIDYLNYKYQTPASKQPVPIYKLPLQQRSMMYLALSKSSSPILKTRLQQISHEMIISGVAKKLVQGYKQALIQKMAQSDEITAAKRH